MGHDSDQMCSTIIISVVLIVLVMACMEMSKLRTRYDTSGTCGRKANIDTKDVSAKESTIGSEANIIDAEFESFAQVDEDWSLNKDEPVDDCNKHQEFEQDEAELSKSFNNWEASEEVSSKFDEAAPNKDMAKKAANIQAISLTTETEAPLGKLGQPSFRDLWEGNRYGKNVVFSEKCPEWGGSDAHFSARSRTNKACS
jgi:hypothetical protein